jgi:glycosyltransferase involved in cell wall biosynthesis
MRIAYVVGWPEGPSSGPFKKIRSQTAAWADEGVEVGLFVLTIERHADDWRALPAARRVLSRTTGPRLALQKEALIGAARHWKPDLIYHRWSLTYPGLVRATRRAKVVLEVNADDIVEYDLMTPLKSRLNRLTRGLVLERVTGLAFVTHELAAVPSFARYRRPSVVVGNGIDLSAVQHRPAPANRRPRLLFIGQPKSPWHGLDKLSLLAQTHPEWDFDIVGPPAGEILDASPNMSFHGLLAADGYTELLAAADIGIGTLALHRAGLNEASPLKVREYLATGLPVIIGHVDTDFPDGADFLLALPNTEDNVRAGAQRIEDFVLSWVGRRVAPELVSHLDHRSKERRRLAFFSSLQ